MTHKGQRTTQHREADYPHAVDIPIPGSGLGQSLNLIIALADTLPGGGEQWGHQTQDARGNRQHWCRIGTKLAADADDIAAQFADLGARRAR